jgi:hypothetical protein
MRAAAHSTHYTCPTCNSRPCPDGSLTHSGWRQLLLVAAGGCSLPNRMPPGPIGLPRWAPLRLVGASSACFPCTSNPASARSRTSFPKPQLETSTAGASLAIPLPPPSLSMDALNTLYRRFGPSITSRPESVPATRRHGATCGVILLGGPPGCTCCSTREYTREPQRLGRFYDSRAAGRCHTSASCQARQEASIIQPAVKRGRLASKTAW